MNKFILADGVNRFVDVNFDQSKKIITCVFLNLQLDNAVKECIANITHGAECNKHLGVYDASDSGTNVSIMLPLQLFGQGVNDFCLTVTARRQNLTVIVEGFETLILQPSNNYCYSSIYTDHV